MYVHAPPNYAYPADSLFAGRLIDDRVVVEWGQYSIVRPICKSMEHKELHSQGLHTPDHQEEVW